MTRTWTVGGVAALFLLLGSANAAPVALHFSASVTQVPLDEVFGDIGFGEAIQGSVIFDTSALDKIPADPATGSYNFGAPFGMTVTIGAHEFTASGSLNIGILNSFVDQFTVLATDPAGDLTLELFLQDNSGTALGNDRLPSALPPLSTFAERDFHLDATSALGEVQVDGELDAPNVAAVPEPSLSQLILASVPVLVAVGRRKQFYK